MLRKIDLHCWHMRSFIGMKQYALPAVIFVSLVIGAMAFVKKGAEHPDKHLEIVLRNIGHQLLLQSSDSTSRVSPVETVDGNTFRISFEQNFAFVPDTLMNLVHQQLAKSDWPTDYTVSVNDCQNDKTVFAYEVNSAQGDLRPCRGRAQKKGCYVIEISFPAKKSFNSGWLFLGIVPVAFAGFFFFRKRKRISASVLPAEELLTEATSAKAEPAKDSTDHKKIGNFTFSVSREMLSINDEIIELSVKEAKALDLLALNQNEVVERDLLMKEIWEKDGVVVIARNVDVLISKLRKRLSADPSIRIINVHGKGYKMIA